ncbi:anoctamin-8-like isoform X2 [Mytilus californianus]|uniref:anoctamin-8-like isoform X2 n=1 Tax=Mytilus californianus TaxID=6549 RepID=UPI0022472137|nr:anoctamin-8-like isoform X2 [Mytilus californianus]
MSIATNIGQSKLQCISSKSPMTCTNETKVQRLPYKLFGKKLLKTSRLVASTQVLTNSAIPTSDCDVVVAFPSDPDTNVLMWLLDKLRERTPDIIVHVRHHSNTKGPVLHLTAAHQSLLKGAEELGIRKPLKEEYGGGMKEFNYEDQECFSGVNASEFFSSQERQSIIHYMLNNLRANEGESLGNITFLEGQSIIPLLETEQVISQVFPLHSTDDLMELRETWMQKFFSKQPLDKICNYFGVKIAMYFAYLGHYTVALCLPALIGFLIWFIQGEDEGADDLDLLIFALFNAIWATLYLEHWKRRSSKLAYDWGTLDKKDELLEDPRPLFTGDLRESPVTGRLEPYYPQWKRNLFRYFVSLPVVLLCLLVVFVVMLLIFQFQEWINRKVAVDSYPGFLTVIPKILLAICIGISDEIYKKIAFWLNDMENYRMDEAYENHLITKLATFQFVNSFLSLFYIAFYLQDMDRLRDQLAAILITRQILGNIKEALLPYLQWQARLCKVGYEMVSDLSPGNSFKGDNSVVKDLQDEPSEGSELKKRSVTFQESSKEENVDYPKRKPGDRRHSIYVKRSLKLTQAEVESEMKKYEDTLEDHLEMLIQFGYVTLFSSAFPLAALCALLNNIIEIRSDAFKLCMHHQRPFGKSVESIGTWQDALELMGIIAVGVNCALIGVSGQIGRLLPVTELSTTIIIIVALEHVILALKLLIAYAIPDVPEAIATKKAKLEFLRREALKKLESQTTSSGSGIVQSLPRQISKNNITQQGNIDSKSQASSPSTTHTSCKISLSNNPSQRNKTDNIKSTASIEDTSEKIDFFTAKKIFAKVNPVQTLPKKDLTRTVTNPYALCEGKKNHINDSMSRSSVSSLRTGHKVTPSAESREGTNQNSHPRYLSRSYSVDSDHIEKYIDRSTGTINRQQYLPDEQIQKLIANAERRRSGTYVSSMTIPIQSSTQRKTIFSVVKSGQSSHVVPSDRHLQQDKDELNKTKDTKGYHSVRSGNMENVNKESSL